MFLHLHQPLVIPHIQGDRQDAEHQSHDVVDVGGFRFLVIDDGQLRDRRCRRRGQANDHGHQDGRQLRHSLQDPTEVQQGRGKHGQDQQTSDLDQIGSAEGKDRLQVPSGDDHTRDQHRRRTYHRRKAFHRRVQDLRDPDVQRQQGNAYIKRDHVGVQQHLLEVDFPAALDGHDAMGPDEQKEGQLQRTCVEDHLLAQDHADQRQCQVPHVGIDQRGLIDRRDLQRLLEQFREQDPDHIGGCHKEHGSKEAFQPCWCQVDLKGPDDQAGGQNEYDQGRDRLTVLDLHDPQPHNGEAHHDHQHHRSQFAGKK